MKTCPIDNSSLKRVKYEFINIFQCEECCGTLLTQEKIEKLKRKQETNNVELEASINDTKTEDNLSKIKCPSCKFTMVKEKAFQNSRGSRRGDLDDFFIDICPSCKSIWLDGSELQKIELDFQQSKFGKMVGENYVSYNKLSKDEKKEYIKTIANSMPDRSEQYFGATVNAILSHISHQYKRYWLFNDG